MGLGVSGFLDEAEGQISSLVRIRINHLGFLVYHLGCHVVEFLHVGPAQIALILEVSCLMETGHLLPWERAILVGFPSKASPW
ncbi:unnamed protein product, partial [Vitis vinifera]|uniref:Uncharacterized protein n=1 Tax=Vitis vinifera TaxID=29760 RepID=D7U3F8_VITVI